MQRQSHVIIVIIDTDAEYIYQTHRKTLPFDNTSLHVLAAALGCTRFYKLSLFTRINP